jgi:hypothetical protein
MREGRRDGGREAEMGKRGRDEGREAGVREERQGWGTRE